MIRVFILLKIMPGVVAQGLLLFGFILVFSKILDFISNSRKSKKEQIERKRQSIIEGERKIQKILEEEETIIQPVAIDLGLSLPILWASENLGAQKINIQGKYFPWCNTKPSLRFKEVVRDTNTFNVNELKSIFKNEDGSFSGVIGYDVATSLLGETWRTPKDSEFQCLINECKWEFIKEGTFSGWKITGPNGNSIRLPMERDRGFVLYYPLTEYWTSSPVMDDNVTNYIKVPTLKAKMVRIDQDKEKREPICRIENRERIFNCYIRPVRDK